jgi:hypothetical protein
MWSSSAKIRRKKKKNLPAINNSMYSERGVEKIIHWWKNNNALWIS